MKRSRIDPFPTSREVVGKKEGAQNQEEIAAYKRLDSIHGLFTKKIAKAKGQTLLRREKKNSTHSKREKTRGRRSRGTSNKES